MSARLKWGRRAEWSCAAVSLVEAAERCRERARGADPSVAQRLRADMRALALEARKWPMWRNRQGVLL